MDARKMARGLLIRCCVVSVRELKARLLLPMRGKYTIRTYVHVVLLLGVITLLCRRYVPAACSQDQAAASLTPRADPALQHLPLQPNFSFVPFNPNSSTTFERTYIYGTKRGATGDVIYVTGLTAKSGEQKEWFKVGDEDFKDCPNLEPHMKCNYAFSERAVTFSLGILVNPRLLGSVELPSSRRHTQKYIFYESEPPPQTRGAVDLTKYHDLFNVTSTYTLDSDILLNQHRTTCVARDSYEEPGPGVAAGKTRQAVWVADECSSQSRREDYVKELQKYMEVDVLGQCGEQRCQDPPQDRDRCLADLINSTYKFYLSFEGSLCREYHTAEQLGRGLELDAVPVVLGLEDYANVLPPGSYVDVRRFPSPRALAEHLLAIDQDDQLFLQYIRRKRAHVCRKPHTISFACALCGYLHRFRYERKAMHDIASYWSEDYRCASPDTFYKGVADDLLTSTPDIPMDVMM